MKQIYTCLLSFLLLSNFLIAQSNGDYRSVGSSSWSTVANWQVYNGGWVAATEYPGQSAGTGTVTIQDGNLVSVNVSPANPIGALTVATGNTATTLSFVSPTTLNVTGAVIINDASGNVSKAIVLVDAAAQLNCASITMKQGSNDNRKSYLSVGAGTVSVLGNITMDADPDRCYIDFTSGILYVAGNITGGAIIPGTGTVNYNNGAGINQNIPLYNYYNLSFTGGASSYYKDLIGNLDIGGAIEINNAILRCNGFNLTLGAAKACNLINNGVLQFNGTGTIITSNGSNLLAMGAGSRIELASASSNIPNFAVYAINTGSIIDVSCGCNQTALDFRSPSWGIVNFISSGTKTIVSNLKAVIVNLALNVTLATGTNNVTFKDNGSGNRNIILDGSLTGTGKFIFNSGGNITVNSGSNPFAFYDLDINFANTANELKLNKNINVAHTLTLTNGKINSQTNTATLDNGTEAQQLVGGSASSYIYSTGAGRLRRNGLAQDAFTTHLFPVGTSNYYLPVAIINSAGTDQDYAINAFEGATTNGVEGGPAVPYKTNIVDAIWNVDRPSGFGTASVTFNWVNSLEGSLFSGYTDTQIKIAKYNAGNWSQFGAAGSGGNANAAANTAVDNFFSFSPFMVGGGSILTTLPVKFTNVRAFEKLQAIQVDWQVATEENVKEYAVQRSANGRDFTTLGQLAARNSGNAESYSFIDGAPFTGVNFYRLQSNDIDGKSGYSSIMKVVRNGKGESIALYPNPVKDRVINLQATLVAKGIYTANVYNSLGKLIKTVNFTHTGGVVTQSLQLPASLPAGQYYLQVRNKNNTSFNQSFVVE